MEQVIGDFSIFIQLVVALLLGAVIGLERTFAGKTAGMRTFALVSLGSALFVIIAQEFALEFRSAHSLSIDPLRVASAVVSGIGFIGAGLIIFSQGDREVHGLTTAAGLWVSAAIGSAVGFGFYGIALFTALLTLFVFVISSKNLFANLR
jgi:putative Mg2+ transporter-C (MgtC) family protein